MTKFRDLLIVMTKTKTKFITYIFLVSIITMIITGILGYIKGIKDMLLASSFLSWIIFFSIISVFYLLYESITEVKQNRYRLLPISDTKLYLGSLVSNLITVMYLFIINILLAKILTFKTNVFNELGLSRTVDLLLCFLLLIIVIMAVMAEITSSTLIGTIIIDIFPGGYQKVVKFVIYAMALFLVMLLSNFMDITKLFRFNIDASSFITTIRVLSLQSLFEIIVFTLLNIYLLKFIDTNK